MSCKPFPTAAGKVSLTPITPKTPQAVSGHASCHASCADPELQIELATKTQTLDALMHLIKTSKTSEALKIGAAEVTRQHAGPSFEF
jgi:hypothetical protein